MRDELIAYLLDEQSPDQRRELERRLQRDAALRQELQHLRSCMGFGEESQDAAEGSAEGQPPVGANDAGDPADGQSPSDLGARTLRRIRTGEACASDVLGTDPANRLGIIDAPGRSCPFTLVDTVVTLGVVMALGMMLLPAMVESREASRRLSCQNNLRQLGVACIRYSDNHGGYFPHIRPGENAGFFIVRLAQNGGVDPDELQTWLVCASSPIAAQLRARGACVSTPTTQQLAGLDCHTRALLIDALPNSYAYRFGYWQGGRYVAVRKQPGRSAPLLADKPDRGNGYRSLNHGGYGQNVLNDDLSVSYWLDPWAPYRDDHLFLNKRNEQAAGYGRNDVVLGDSAATPGVAPAVVGDAY
ncbi:hypothetical protein Pla175_05000 [Pirellulimonas nuda]|uniref:DUF1559 domain-containing protein n=1 Tax=Pirellulimonas nuda TaxID=2528009 RepID=A0A518D6N1_9BACT|nr:DUF1559 domain-containing protein [Pirellulimonas nuda]QDU87144.1 hypothetical protein Pla175_05000 [Pirellulimonas nuda]